MSQVNPADFYHSQTKAHSAELQDVDQRIKRISRLRLLTVLAALVLAYFAFRDGAGWQWLLLGLLAACFFVEVRVHQRWHEASALLQIRIRINQQELAAMAGDFSPFDRGDRFTDATHPFSYDLDIFGKGSIFSLLSRCITQNGSAQLAEMLNHPDPNPERILERQEIIRELSLMPQFLEDYRAAGMSAAEEATDYQLLTAWLDSPDDLAGHKMARVAAVVLPLLTGALLIWSVVDGKVHPLLGLAVVFNWITLGIFSSRLKKANRQVGKAASLVGKYARLQQQVAAVAFQHPWLQLASDQCKVALGQIGRFRRLAHRLESNSNGMTGPLVNSLFLFDLNGVIQLEKWRRAHKALLLETMELLIAMDVYLSGGVYAFNHPEHQYPDIAPVGREIQAVGLRHPLLPARAVGNDFSLGRQEQFYLLTGANMTGKSTFIRTVGVSMVLGYLGLPLPCASLTLPLLRLYTSIRVTDSVQDDISYFRAELNRMQAIMTAVASAGAPYLVLLDEPLRGTNSADKQMGTRSILEKLLLDDAIGIVATHDVGLCSLEQAHPGQVSNYHFESTVGSEGLTFDYLLRPGGSTSNNATILMRQMGIIT